MAQMELFTSALGEVISNHITHEHYYDEYRKGNISAEKVIADFEATNGAEYAERVRADLRADPKKLESLRRQAIRDAWKQERDLVQRTGQGTRAWTEAQINELLDTGKVSGFDGHHIRSVQAYPEHAGNPENIRFYERNEHYETHMRNWRTPTYGPMLRRAMSEIDASSVE